MSGKRRSRPGLQGFQSWTRAMRWQCAVDRALEPMGLTHTQYWVLSTAAYCIEAADDAVSQQHIADEAELDARRLEPDQGRVAMRVLITSSG